MKREKEKIDNFLEIDEGDENIYWNEENGDSEGDEFEEEEFVTEEEEFDDDEEWEEIEEDETEVDGEEVEEDWEEDFEEFDDWNEEDEIDVIEDDDYKFLTQDTSEEYRIQKSILTGDLRASDLETFLNNNYLGDSPVMIKISHNGKEITAFLNEVMFSNNTLILRGASIGETREL